MPKMIIKHRRGTTEEWNNSTIIPAEGELVIEETNDGRQKFKLGNGYSLFKDLPYTDEKIQQSVDLANARVDNFIAMTDVDNSDPLYEVQDIRVGYDGITYATAGEAVRAIGEDTNNLRNSLQQFINADAVDGLLYENNMLQLTASGMPVGDPVEVVGGSGGGGGTGTSIIIRVRNEMDSTALSVPDGSPVELRFSFTSTEDDIPTGDGTCNIQVDGTQKASFGIKQGSNIVDVSDYVNPGSNNVRVTCMDQYGNSRSLVYTITIIELRITSIFDCTSPFESDITFKYTPYGLIEKDIHFAVDGKEVAKTTITASGKQATQILPAMSHGVHKLDVFMTTDINGAEVESNHLLYDVMCLESGKTDALLSSVYTTTEIVQGNLVSIPYIIYDPSSLTATIQLIVSYMKEGEEVEYSNTTITVDRAQQYWNTRLYPEGNVKFTILYNYNWNEEYQQYLKSVSKSFSVKVSEPDIDVEPVTNDLELLLTSAGRSNNETDPAQWTYNSVTTTFENFNWKSNGWVADANGDTCLRLTGDAKATINFMPFEEDFREFGKTLEFEFAVRDVNNRDAKVISCYSDGIGFEATADTAFLKSEGKEVSCNYKDEERLRIGFSVERRKEGTRFISIYLDGVLSGVTQYAETDNFQQKNPVKITLGSEYCGLDIYSIRVYSTALNAQQMIDNYIYDMNDPVQKVDIFADNDIYDDYTGLLSYKKLKQKIPTITFIGKMPTYKGDKKKNSVRMIFEHPTHPELNFDEILAQIDVQGTSSAGYVRKNWKTKTTKKYVHKPDELPAKVFCLKVDYAEGTGTHNTQNANFVETLYSEPVLPQLDEPKIRTTITGYPIVIFELDTDDMDLITNITKDELESRTDVKFSSKGNFNYDKDAEDVFGFNDDYDTECWEFCNNTSDSVRFLGNIPVDYSSDFEARYHPKLGDLEDLEDAAVKDDTAIANLKNEMIQRFKIMHDWVVSTNRNAATGAALDETYVDVLGVEYTHDTAEYRLAKFKTEFEQYFDLHYTSVYYVYTLFALMVDQRAKNFFLTYWHDHDEDGDVLATGKWYPYFYDNDTSFGINNEGKKVFDYFHEDTDVVNGQNVYNGQDSVLWCNFRDTFPSVIRDTYAELRSSKLTEEKLLKQFIDDGSDMWSASVYNEDAEYKYVSLARPDYDADGDGKSDATSTYLYQVTGNGEHHFKYFVANRLKYCDSKWYAGNYFTDQIYLRIYTPRLAGYPEGATDEEKAAIDAKNEATTTSLAAVPACADITVVPYSDVYAGVRYKAVSGDDITLNLQQQRVSKNASVTFRAPVNPETGKQEEFNDTETYIYGASDLSSLGDLSPLYCGYIDVSRATKLTHLQIGNHTEGYQNLNLHHLSVGSNQLLKTIDITNCVNLADPLDVSNCKNIEEIYAEGSGITSVILPDAGYVRIVKLPDTITNLTIKNQLYIQTLSFENYKGIKTLCIDNCPTIDTVQLLNNCKDEEGNYTVERVRLTGINWPNASMEFLRSLYPIRGLDADGANTNDAYLIGTAHISKLTGAEMAEIKSHYPYLTITYDELTATITFKDSTGTQVLDEQIIVSKNSKASSAYCPVIAGEVPEPTRESTAQYHFHWAGWTTQFDNPTSVELDALHAVTSDRVVYPAFDPELRRYQVRFWNDDYLESTVLAWYGSEAIYGLDNTGDTDGDHVADDKEPVKRNTSEPQLFEFTGWHPKPEYVTGEMDCYAQFYIDIGDYYLIGNNDIKYELLPSNCLKITDYTNASENVVSIPEQFTISANTVTTTEVGGFDDTTVELVHIPETVDTFSERAFNNCEKLTELTIGPNVKTINDMSFANCTGLRKVNYNAVDATVIRNTVTESPFENSGVDTGMIVTIGKDVQQIPSYLFNQYNDANERTYTIANLIWEDGSVCTTINSGAFRNTNVPEFNVPDTITVIGAEAFANNYYIEEVILPPNLTKLQLKAFQNLHVLKHVWIPKTVTLIGEGAFSYTPELDTIEVESGNSYYTVTDNCLINRSAKKLLRGTNNAIVPQDGTVQELESACFSHLKRIEEIAIPTGVVTIPTYFAVRCENLDRVVLPATLNRIESQAFYFCGNLGKSDNGVLVIPDNVTVINSNAFSYCTSLKDVTLPKSLKDMGSGDNFAYCTSLETVTFRTADTPVNEYGEGAFRGCTNLKDVYWPGTQTLAETANLWQHMGIDTTKVTIHYEYEVRD